MTAKELAAMLHHKEYVSIVLEDLSSVTDCGPLEIALKVIKAVQKL